MKHGNGIKDQDEKSSGIEILMTEVVAKVKPTEPSRLPKQESWNKTDPIPPVFHYPKPILRVTVSVQEQKTTKVIINVSRSVNYDGHKSDWIGTT